MLEPEVWPTLPAYDLLRMVCPEKDTFKLPWANTEIRGTTGTARRRFESPMPLAAITPP